MPETNHTASHLHKETNHIFILKRLLISSGGGGVGEGGRAGRVRAFQGLSLKCLLVKGVGFLQRSHGIP